MGTQQYRVNGKRVPSVTTVLGRFKDPGALMYWSWNVAYKVLEEAIHLLENNLDKTEVRAFLNSNPHSRGNFRHESGKAAEAGTIAHDIVEEWIHAGDVARGNMERMSTRHLATTKKIEKKVAEQSLNSFHAFVKWTESHRFELVETEVPLLSEEYEFGGTVDCLAWIDDKFVIFDWKTSKGLYMDYLLQLAAYGSLVHENYEDTIQGYHLVRIDKATADFHHHSWSTMDIEREMFLLLRKCYGLAKEVEKRCK